MTEHELPGGAAPAGEISAPSQPNPAQQGWAIPTEPAQPANPRICPRCGLPQPEDAPCCPRCGLPTNLMPLPPQPRPAPKPFSANWREIAAAVAMYLLAWWYLWKTEGPLGRDVMSQRGCALVPFRGSSLICAQTPTSLHQGSLCAGMPLICTAL